MCMCRVVFVFPLVFYVLRLAVRKLYLQVDLWLLFSVHNLLSRNAGKVSKWKFFISLEAQ